MCSAYKLNKQGENTQPWCTSFPILNQSIVPCPVLTVASWFAYRFLRRHGRWSGIPTSLRIFQFIVIHTVKCFGVVSKADLDIFLELSCIISVPTEVGNLTSGSSLFSKSKLHIWKFSLHVLLKSGLKNVEHCFASMWDKCSCEVVWAFVGIAFLREWKLMFSSPVATTEFSKYGGILNAALSQHHLLELEIAQQEFHHLH